MKQARFMVFIVSLVFSLLSPAATANESTIWEKLQGKSPSGYVLLIRHSLAPGVGDPENFKLGDCSTQRNLSQQGRAQAAKLGNWLKETEIAIYRIESSRWCRALDTARLIDVGTVKPNRNLDSLFQEVNIANHPKTIRIKNQIKKHRNIPGLLVMVGHYVNIAAITGIALDSGSGVLVRVNKRGLIKVVGLTPNFEN